MKIAAILAMSLSLSLPAYAQHAHGNHSQSVAKTEANIETGQAAFAAIADVVELLKSDPKTDWNTVNIQGLRDHLLDMNNVTMLSNVSTKLIKGGAVFEVTGSPNVAQSIQRMTSAHSQILASDLGFTMSVKTLPNGAEVTVHSEGLDGEAYIRGLGFYGIMTIGAHHQEHHLMMAMGKHPH